MNFYITVNNREIEAMKGETILQALRRAGISVPTLCNMEGFTPTGACRLCMVEIAGKTDLVPACSHPVEEWMDVQTHTPRVIKARRMIVELLLANHPDDCLYCERNCHCELQDLAFELNIRERKHSSKRISKIKDLSSPAIIRDPAKCILCGRCVRVCEEVIGCSTFEFSGRGKGSGITTHYNHGLNQSSCIACGQCVMACPTGALYEKKNMAEFQAVMRNPKYYPVALVDPVVNITMAEMNNNRNLRQAARQLNGVLKKCGFMEIYDYASAQDLYIREVTKEILEGGGELLLSANCPAWVKYAEQFLPAHLDRLSSVKSPSQIAGSIIKHQHKSTLNAPDAPIPYFISITPCTARKFEAKRKEFSPLPAPEVDLAITTRALEQLIRLNGFDINSAEAEEFNRPFHTSSLHGELGGIAGGTMEAVAATVYEHLTGGEGLVESKIKKIRASRNVKEIEFVHKKKRYCFAAVSGMAEAAKFVQEALLTPGKYQFIEVMACPNGCVNGGGQPLHKEKIKQKQRQKQLLELADKNALKTCYRNRTIDDLIAALGTAAEMVKPLIHTNYYPRKID
jgi:NADH dehydrogenase/NADH:ubiquinone oxidoreductase subunit G